MKTIRETLDLIGSPVPPSVISVLKEKGAPSYISWYDRADLMDERAPGWCKRIVEVGQMTATRQKGDEKTLTYVVMEITIPCTDGVLVRQATGTDDTPDNLYGTPLDRAEASSFGRCTAAFGLGRGLYQGNGTEIRYARIAARNERRAKEAAEREGIDTNTGEIQTQAEHELAASQERAALAEPTTSEWLTPEEDPAPATSGVAEQLRNPVAFNEPTGGIGQDDNADEPPPTKRGRADWEPDSWKAAAAEAVAGGKLNSILGPAGLKALAQKIGPDNPSKPPEHQTHRRRGQVLILLDEAACQICIEQAPNWSPEVCAKARAMILEIKSKPPARTEALVALKRGTKAPVKNGGVGEYPADWPSEDPSQPGAPDWPKDEPPAPEDPALSK